MRGRGLAGELVEGDRRIVTAAKPAGAGLDEVAHERPVLVERRPCRPAVLLEREGKRVALVLELAEEIGERAEHEPPQGVVELRRANGHADGYAPAGANPRQAAPPGGPGSWQRGHQYAVRFRSPRPRDAIGVPHRGHERRARR